MTLYDAETWEIWYSYSITSRRKIPKIRQTYRGMPGVRVIIVDAEGHEVGCN